MVLDDDNPWDGKLTSIMFALRASVYATVQYIPAQLVFGWDSIMNRGHDLDLEAVMKYQ